MANTGSPIVDMSRRAPVQALQRPAKPTFGIPRATPGPTEPAKVVVPPPRPTMMQMQGLDPVAQAESEATPRMVYEADLLELIPWTVPKLNDYYKNMTQASLMSFCRQNSMNNRMKFLRTKNSWGCFEAYSDPLEPNIIVRNKWYVSRKSTFIEVMNLLNAFERWATSIGATQFWMDSPPGIDISPFVKKLDGFEVGHTLYVKNLK